MGRIAARRSDRRTREERSTGRRVDEPSADYHGLALQDRATRRLAWGAGEVLLENGEVVEIDVVVIVVEVEADAIALKFDKVG